MFFRLIFLGIAVVQARGLDSVNYGAFTQTATYSIANQLGFFTAYGLDVFYQQVPNSTYAYTQILNGGYDILTGTIDNAVNLRLNSNENVTVIGQLDQGPDLVLASSPNITSVAQLKGKSLIVDSPVSGYSYLLRKILSTHGLLLNTDYFFQVRSPRVHVCVV
jgi:ABC-type nitrate/sulfonate/bicarbonate transport system substrate-binding protein